jgi:hypothetical protein
MGIAPIRQTPAELENQLFRAIVNPKCDGRVKFWRYTVLHRDT